MLRKQEEKKEESENQRRSTQRLATRPRCLFVLPLCQFDTIRMVVPFFFAKGAITVQEDSSFINLFVCVGRFRTNPRQKSIRTKGGPGLRPARGGGKNTFGLEPNRNEQTGGSGPGQPTEDAHLSRSVGCALVEEEFLVRCGATVCV